MKRVRLLVIVGVLFSLIAITLILAAITDNLFTDGFEVDTFAATWTSNVAYERQSGVAAGIDAGAWSIVVDGAVTDGIMEITNAINISNYTTCNLTARVYIEASFDGPDYICMDYSIDDGATWNLDTGADGGVGGLCQDGNVDTEDAFRTIEYSSVSPSGVTAFKYRFRSSAGNSNEDGYIDNVNLTCIKNTIPTIENITASHTVIKGGNTITIWANTTSHWVNDTEAEELFLYCSTDTAPTAANTDCTGGTLNDATYPYALTCTFATPTTDTTYTEFCRIYDGASYSSTIPNITYTTDSSPPTTTVTSVAGDSVAAYYDTVNDAVTIINVSGEASMVCRWSTIDQVYSAMSNTCTISGSYAACSITGLSQGFTTRYVSCQDQYVNEQTTGQNLDVQFTLDYTAPTTSDNSVASVQVPDYTVTITETDNIDADPDTLYCTNTADSCTPNLVIDDGGVVTFTSANRGVNYLRYNSTDSAGNSQSIQSSIININQLPVFTSATDNAITIRGGSAINITSVSSDADSGQEMTLWVCKTNLANSAGCGGEEYCNVTSTENMNCTFNAESDSALHNWYAFVYDELNEIAAANRTGSYTTDLTVPSITINSPGNDTITQSSVTFTITLDEALTNAWHSLDSGTNNVSMSNNSLFTYTHSNTSISDGSYTVQFWANDTYENINTTSISFTINTVGVDSTPPTITIRSPVNNIYYTIASTIFNISSNEALKWAGYTLNEGSLTDLENISTTRWNKTINLPEGRNNITFYANDTSNNQANKSIFIFTDLTNPDVDGFSCTDVADSADVVCSANLSDEVSLDYAIIGWDATGSWQNSSQISLSGTSDSLSYTIASGNHSPGTFTAEVYLYDSSGKINTTISDTVTILDNTFPEIYNITYIPNTTALLDPGKLINITMNIVEDYDVDSVVLMYKNLSVGTWTEKTMVNSTSLTKYNNNFTVREDTWYFQINATDAAGNSNVSSLYTLVVANDSSQTITTTIPAVKSILSVNRAGNSSMGRLEMNNSGETTLNFNITLTSDNVTIQNRLSVNYTGNNSVNYTATPGNDINITIDINTTGLASALYDYNITISSDAGTTILQKQLNIQTFVAPYLDVDITTYSSSVDAGDTEISLIAKVTNLGTSAATGTYLNWALPSQFTITSGTQNRSLGTIGISESGTNTIVISVASDASNANVTINATATASNSDSRSDAKTITIGEPAAPTPEVTPQGPGGGGTSISGTSVGGGAFVSYDKIINVVRGESEEFEIEVFNRHSNTTLKDLSLSLTGFLEKYLRISTPKISSIEYNNTKWFTVILAVPSYKSYEEHELTAIITGKIVRNGVEQPYTETQNILLRIQEISYEKSNLSLTDAEKAIQEMQDSNFSTNILESLLTIAKQKLKDNRNKEAKDIADMIVKTKDQAFKINALIKNLIEVFINPRKIRLLTDDKLKSKEKFDIQLLRDGDFSKVDSLVDGEEIRELLDLAIVAFNRGDYDLAEERVNSANILFLLNAKGNFILFLALYWPFIMIGIVGLSGGGIFGYKKYQKSSITKKIENFDKEEDNIRELIKESQKKYFTAKISSGEYDRQLNQHEKRLTSISKMRMSLRNTRVKMLSPMQITQDLETEKMQVESEIKEIQTAFYKDRKISEKEYKLQFKVLNERLAEIEGERTTLELMKKMKEGKKKKIIENSGKEKQEEKIVEKNMEHSTRRFEEKLIKKENRKILMHKILRFPVIIFNKIKGKIKGKKQTDHKDILGKELVLFKDNTKRKIKKIQDSLRESPKKIIKKIKGVDKKGIMMIDNELIERLKEHAQDKDYKNKWINLNLKDKGGGNDNKN